MLLLDGRAGPVIMCRFDKNPEYCRGPSSCLGVGRDGRDMCKREGWMWWDVMMRRVGWP